MVKNSLFVSDDTVLLPFVNNKSKAGSLITGRRETEPMAKGNDGNYLQHCIEVEAAVRLAGMDTAGRLHIALTHGMRPFEPFEKKKYVQMAY